MSKKPLEIEEPNVDSRIPMPPGAIPQMGGMKVSQTQENHERKQAKKISISMPEDVLFCARKSAAADGKNLSRWIADLIEKQVKSATGKKKIQEYINFEQKMAEDFAK